MSSFYKLNCKIGNWQELFYQECRHTTPVNPPHPALVARQRMGVCFMEWGSSLLDANND